MNTFFTSFLPRIGAAAIALLLSGCATVNGLQPDEQDPYERFNRAMTRFNDVVDDNVAKPVARLYDNVVPTPVNRGISNFFSNLDDVVVMLNNVLQGKLRQAGSDLSRIMFNSTAGLFGFIDVSTSLGLPKHNEDFGQTLGYWGLGPGPYLVLPLLGPSTVRDTAAKPVDWVTDPLWVLLEDPATYWGAWSLRVVDARAELLRATNILEQASLDRYVFTREAVLQRRQNLVYDGNPPQEEEFDIFEEDEISPDEPSEAAPEASPAP